MKTNLCLTFVLMSAVFTMGNLGRFEAETIPPVPQADQTNVSGQNH